MSLFIDFSLSFGAHGRAMADFRSVGVVHKHVLLAPSVARILPALKNNLEQYNKMDIKVPRMTVGNARNKENKGFSTS